MARIYEWGYYFPTITVEDYMCNQCCDVFEFTFYINQQRAECPHCGGMTLTTSSYIQALIDGDVTNPLFWLS